MALRCVDASFVVAWFIPGDQSEAVEEAWTSYARGEDQFVGPPLLYVETISVVRRLAHRGFLSNEEAGAIVEDFLALEIPTPVPAGLYQMSYNLARRYNQPRAYDACYLALAKIMYCQLMTLDQRLYNAVAGDFPHIRLVGQ